VQLGPCTVVGVRSQATHGYDALQLGFEVKGKNVTKAMAGVYRKAGIDRPMRVLREIRLQKSENLAPYQVGQKLTAEMFRPGEFVRGVGVSTGMGFHDGVKRNARNYGLVSQGSELHLCARPPAAT